MTDDTEEQDLEILRALAEIADVGDFRLGDFMRERGLNPHQPVVFYRQLIKEAREAMAFVELLQESVDIDADMVTKLRADLSVKDEQIKTLGAKLRRLEAEAYSKTDSLKKERNGLEATASQLQEKAEIYEGIKNLLQGKQGTRELGALYRLVADMNMEMLLAEVGQRPPPNLERLDIIRQRLRDELMEVLEIPHDTLETDNARLKEQIDAIVGMLKRLYGGGG